MNLHAAPPSALSAPGVARIPPDPSLPSHERNWHDRFPYQDYVELAADLAAVPSARHLLRADVKQWGLRGLLDDAELVTTEIVSNAVNATRAMCWPASRPPVRMWVRGGWLHGAGILVVLVWDACPTAPAPGSPDTMDEAGRGLLFISAYSRWGYYHPSSEDVGKVIWAQFPKPPDPEVGQGAARTE
jgi:hypothetical protein